MKLELQKSFIARTATLAIKTVLRIINGKDNDEPIGDGTTSIATFPELEAVLKSDAERAKADNLAPRRAADLRYSFAMLRDARYMHRGRRHAMGLGLHNTLRSFYEKGRIDNNNPK